MVTIPVKVSVSTPFENLVEVNKIKLENCSMIRSPFIKETASQYSPSFKKKSTKQNKSIVKIVGSINFIFIEFLNSFLSIFSNFLFFFFYVLSRGLSIFLPIEIFFCFFGARVCLIYKQTNKIPHILLCQSVTTYLRIKRICP